MSEDAMTPDGESAPQPTVPQAPNANATAPATAAAVADADAADDANGSKEGILIEVETSDPPAQRIAELEAQVAKLTQEKKDLWERFVRSAADLENGRKRAKRDLDDARHDARTRVLKEMLPVADNLERAVAHSSGADAGAIIEGVRLVLRQLAHAFERAEVAGIDADGKPFDPNQHEAIGQQESDEPPGTVVSVLQRGYRLGDKLLRPALVVVAKARTVAAPPVEPVAAASGEPATAGASADSAGSPDGSAPPAQDKA